MSGADFELYLASGSPRRRRLLKQIGVRFRSLPTGIEERRRRVEDATGFACRMAREKADAGLALAGEGVPPVLGADTVVELDGVVLGKPRDRAEGIDMLGRLSGRTHRVISAVCVATAAARAERIQVSHVRFAVLSPALIEAYWATGEPRDKAGAYAIQGLAGAFVERLEGSYSGVMGLPLHDTVSALTEAGVFSGEAGFLQERR